MEEQYSNRTVRNVSCRNLHFCYLLCLSMPLFAAKYISILWLRWTCKKVGIFFKLQTKTCSAIKLYEQKDICVCCSSFIFFGNVNQNQNFYIHWFQPKLNVSHVSMIDTEAKAHSKHCIPGCIIPSACFKEVSECLFSFYSWVMLLLERTMVKTTKKATNLHNNSFQFE